MEETAVTTLHPLESKIYFIRNQRVMIDSDLAYIYGVSTMHLNQQFKRNRDRFPIDFAFQLDPEEYRNLISQIAISTSTHGGRRKLPWGFTEHGALMLANVLRSRTATEASVRVVRAFVHLREMLAGNKQLAAKFAELERRMDANDGAIKTLFDAIRKLLEAPPATQQKRGEMGFHIKEKAGRYRTRADI